MNRHMYLCIDTSLMNLKTRGWKNSFIDTKGLRSTHRAKLHCLYRLIRVLNRYKMALDRHMRAMHRLILCYFRKTEKLKLHESTHATLVSTQEGFVLIRN